MLSTVKCGANIKIKYKTSFSFQDNIVLKIEMLIVIRERRRVKGILKYCGIMHIKEPLLLIGKSRPGGGSGFLFTICLTPYNRKISFIFYGQ